MKQDTIDRQVIRDYIEKLKRCLKKNNHLCGDNKSYRTKQEILCYGQRGSIQVTIQNLEEILEEN
ncbi:MAG: hypothetical protein WCS51_02445 [Bacilli bacterium]